MPNPTRKGKILFNLPFHSERFFYGEKMKKVTISRTNLGKKEQKQIYEIEKIDNSKHRLLGQSVGININHCVLLGTKNCNNFWHRVRFFQKIQNEEISINASNKTVLTFEYYS